MSRITHPRAAEIEAAFKAMVEKLDLPLQPASFEIGEHLDIGFLYGIFATEMLDVPLADEEEIGSADDTAIRTAVEGFERLRPVEYAVKEKPEDDKFGFGRFAHDPYLVLREDAIGLVDSGNYKGIEEYDMHKRSHPTKHPREVMLQNFSIVHLGAMRAIATYGVQETLANGETHLANSFAVLGKLENEGWRILIACDHRCDADAEAGSGEGGGAD